MNKLQILKDFIKKQDIQPVQGSKEWHDSRKDTIGGSVIGQIIEPINKYTHESNIINLIKSKIGLQVFTGNIHTSWGSLLESFAIKYFQMLFNTEVFSTGSVKDIVPGIAYSPDGLCYISLADLIILLEIKCPTRRIPNSRVPDNYLPQIYTGLQVIKICDASIFIDCAFRRCSIQDFVFNDNKHDTILHKFNKFNVDEIKLCLVGFYGTTEEKELDLGSVSIEKLEDILNNKQLGIYYSEIIYNDSKNTLIDDYHTFLDGILDGKKSVGILPLKLMRVDLSVVDRYDWNYNDDGKEYLDRYSEIIPNIITLIKKLNELSYDEKINDIKKNNDEYIRIFTL